MRNLSLLSILLLIGRFGIFAQTASDREFLSTLEDGASYAAIFKARMSFETHNSSGAVSNAHLLLWENEGKAIVQFQSPSRDKGKALLHIGSKYWMYFPRAKRSTVLSPMANMVGNASNGDILRPPQGELYDITLLNDTPRAGNRVVQFIASSRQAPYGKIISHYQDYKVLESEMYSRSGVLLKRAYFDNHVRSVDGNAWIATTTRIVDGTNPNVYTIIILSDLEQLTRINESWFNPNNLGRVR